MLILKWFRRGDIIAPFGAFGVPRPFSLQYSNIDFIHLDRDWKHTRRPIELQYMHWAGSMQVAGLMRGPMADAERAGRAAVTYDGMMIDYAHVRNALDLIHQAEAFGIEVGEYAAVKAL